MIIITKKKSRWRGQSFPCIGTFDSYYICKVGHKQFTRIRKSEVAAIEEKQVIVG